VLREVRERNARAQAAWDESHRLEAALRALEGERSRARPPRRTGRTQPRLSAGRAPRGQIRDAILRVVAERPGATAGEIAAAAKVDRRVSQSTLARLARQGAIERYSPPGGGTAYRPPSPTSEADTTEASSQPPNAGADRERDARVSDDETADER